VPDNGSNAEDDARRYEQAHAVPDDDRPTKLEILRDELDWTFDPNGGW
jgi:hypothetical protein